MSGMEWVPYAASAAASAAGSIYSSNQANNAASGNAYMANFTNMAMQAQNQQYNAEQAQWAREFNSAEARSNRTFQSEAMKSSQDFASNMAHETNDFNSREAQTNREFQMGMSNTAYQRATEDMKKAGLNPMLAYSQGGASSPSGSSAQGAAQGGGMAGGSQASGGAASSGGAPGAQQPHNMRLPLEAIGNSALDLMMKKASVERVEAETENIKAATPGVATTSERLAVDLNRYKKNIDLFVKGDAWDNLSKGEQNEILQIRKELDRANKNTETAEGWQANRQLIQSAEQLIKEYHMRGEALGMTEKRASSKFFEDTGNTNQWMQMGGNLLKLVMMMGRGIK